ncbi:MAG: hypothetical protein LYZ70_01715 [Nitrososphaerales archaeon]|nr:hypothetical protein [Nitrososphaerales archaeon]
MSRPEGAKRDTNASTAQLVQLISEIGPDVAEIARRLGQFKESVRYRYKSKILKKGFAVQAAADYEKLGLRRVMFVASFAGDFRRYASTILTAMSELCYVVYFARVLPEGRYIVNAAVPTEFVDRFAELIHALKSKGLFSSVEVLNFEWARNPPMRAEFYDFDIGRWDFDWSTVGKMNYGAAAYVPSNREKFDYTDLLIVKELQKDATRSLTEIADQLKVNYKKLAWHYATHIIGRKLLRSYRINWMGTRYNYRIEKALHRKHRYVELVLVVRDLKGRERMELMSSTNRLPFLWFEASGKNYYADFAFPIDSMTEALEYLATVLEPFEGRYDHYAIDTTNALTFSIAYQLYDQNLGKWAFNSADLLSRFDNLMMKIRAAG